MAIWKLLKDTFKRKPVVVVTYNRQTVDCSIHNKIHTQLALELKHERSSS